jgi:hypothetical protein
LDYNECNTVTVTVVHKFVSTIPDDPSVPQEVRPSNWNDAHSVVGGTTGYALTISGTGFGEMPLSGLLPAPSNLTWYVATTGSDNNSGTSGSPFLTIQRALAVAASYDWQHLYFPTINVAGGTYAFAATYLYLPPLTNLPAVTLGQIIGDTSMPSNVVVHNTQAGGNLFYSFGFGALWYVNGFQTDCSAAAYSADYGGVIEIGNAVFADSSASGNMIPFQCLQTGILQDDGSNFTLTATTINGFVFANNFAIVILTGTYTLPSTITVGNQFLGAGIWSSIDASETTFSSSTVTGTGAGITIFSEIIWSGAPSTVPGNATTMDATSAFFDVTLTNGASRFFATQQAGLPTAAANLNPGAWGVFKDTSGGGVYVAYNDAGTIKKVALT